QDVLREAERVLERFKDDAERRTAREFLQSLGAVQHVLATCRLDDGLGCGCLCVFPKEGNETAKKFLTALRAGDEPSSLKGLPGGDLVAATAARGDGSKNHHTARVLSDLPQRNILEMYRIFGEHDRHGVLAVFNELWPHLQGSRFALYKTADERKLGLFS